MNIQIGKYRIVSDPYNVFMYEEKERINDEGEIKISKKRITGYHSNVKNCLKDFCNKKLLDNNCQSVEEFLQLAVEIENDLIKICDKIEKEK